MPNLAAARAELNHIEAVLRTRYHYPHPIFDYIAAALGHLEGDLPPEAEAPVVHPEQPVMAVPGPNTETTIAASDSVSEEDAEPEAEKPLAPARRKRGET